MKQPSPFQRLVYKAGVHSLAPGETDSMTPAEVRGYGRRHIANVGTAILTAAGVITGGAFFAARQYDRSPTVQYQNDLHKLQTGDGSFQDNPSLRELEGVTSTEVAHNPFVNTGERPDGQIVVVTPEPDHK